MKRTLISAVTLLALAGLTACGAKDDPASTTPSPAATPDSGKSPTEKPTDNPTEKPTTPEVTSNEARFQDMSKEITILVNNISSPPGNVDPTNTDEANKAAGLDKSTPLSFGDYSANKEGSKGSFCLLSSVNDTYFAFSYTGKETFMGFGDGECSYNKADAVVVGDVASDKWVKGAELMGKLTPLTVMGAS